MVSAARVANTFRQPVQIISSVVTLITEPAPGITALSAHR